MSFSYNVSTKEGEQLRDVEQMTPASKTIKRKGFTPRSMVWNHFQKFTNNEGKKMAKCTYCGVSLRADPKINGTSSLKSHVMTCPCKPLPDDEAEEKCQRMIHKQCRVDEEEGSNSSNSNKFDQLKVREALVRMIILDGLPFKIVEAEGFRQFITALCPMFSIPSRIIIIKDCYALFMKEKSKLMKLLKECNGRVSLSVSTCSSMHGISYMCLTVHFIDNEWTLHRRILSFCPISSHKGKYIGRAIERCLLDWGIDRLMAITVDDTGSNDVVIEYLKKAIQNWGTALLANQHLHMRCIAHVINSVVVDGLEEINVSLRRVRESVRFVRQSSARLALFKECGEVEKIQSSKTLYLDDPTRWNSTFLMLDTAQIFERVFTRFEDSEPLIVGELEDSVGGTPSKLDWENIRRMTSCLKLFYELTMKVSGSSYVTLNIFFNEISYVYCLLKDWINGDDQALSNMAVNMMAKYEKHWGNIDKMNKLIFIAAVLDPRYKLDYVQFVIKEMYGDENGEKLNKKVEAVLNELFKAYVTLHGSGNSSSSHVMKEPSTQEIVSLTARYKKYKSESGSSKSELEKYLTEDQEGDGDAFDTLKWWKVNTRRFPILSQMACDILAMPVSAVASEFAFSTGERVLDAFRSSLTPPLVEALICTQNWLRTSSPIIHVEEELEDLVQMENVMSEMTKTHATSATIDQ